MNNDSPAADDQKPAKVVVWYWNWPEECWDFDLEPAPEPLRISLDDPDLI